MNIIERFKHRFSTLTLKDIEDDIVKALSKSVPVLKWGLAILTIVLIIMLAVAVYHFGWAAVLAYIGGFLLRTYAMIKTTGLWISAKKFFQLGLVGMGKAGAKIIGSGVVKRAAINKSKDTAIKVVQKTPFKKAVGLYILEMWDGMLQWPLSKWFKRIIPTVTGFFAVMWFINPLKWILIILGKVFGATWQNALLKNFAWLFGQFTGFLTILTTLLSSWKDFAIALLLSVVFEKIPFLGRVFTSLTTFFLLIYNFCMIPVRFVKTHLDSVYQAITMRMKNQIHWWTTCILLKIADMREYGLGETIDLMLEVRNIEKELLFKFISIKVSDEEEFVIIKDEEMQRERDRINAKKKMAQAECELNYRKAWIKRNII